MKVLNSIQGISISLLLVLFMTSSLMAAPACKGPNKNDPGCAVAEPSTLDADSVDSVTVDWFNQVLVVRGTDIDAATDWVLGGSPSLTNAAVINPNMVEIGFDADIAAQVQGGGSYLLTADGNAQLTIYIEHQIIDPAATGCPCQGTWAAEIPDWVGLTETACLEISGPGSNDQADISGTYTPVNVLEDPQFSFAASFNPGDPANSVCRLVQVNPDLTVAELVNFQINENQQADCRAELAANACFSITPVP